MTQRNMLFDIEAAKREIENHHGPVGVRVDLVDGTSCHFRIQRQNGSVYYGVTDKGNTVVMNIATGQFDIGD